MSDAKVFQDAKRGASLGAAAPRSNASFNTPRGVDAGDADVDFGGFGRLLGGGL
ncbi:hypothetical protein [Rhodovulum sulfidophilum]|uniref:hypothetical protein n=1 Tax=Rhodovulum sulfidophilum TaxID=35806 RepID=UPI0015BE81B3|nr:hypothetical protein [Rhodovulum sulfidophilum]MBL3551347.1 hypothetical protein [Rhodovulum sulfidophilum]